MTKSYLGFPYIINFCNLTQTRVNTGFIRNIRRVQQAPYPLIKVRLEELTPVANCRNPDKNTKQLSRIEPKSDHDTHRSSSSQNSKKQSSKKSTRSRGKQNVDSTVNLARSILNNLNIFGNKITHVSTPESGILDADSSSTKSGRRPSVDTVSTYLSHESKDSDSRSTQVSNMITCNKIIFMFK